LTAIFYPLATRNVIEPRHYEGCQSRKDDDNQTAKDRIAHLSKALVHHSTATENSTLRLEDAEKILTTGIVPKELSTREVYEAKSMAKITAPLLHNPKQPLTVQLILDWRELLLANIDVKGGIAVNKAKRQTIPAFRLREKRMISEAYREKMR
jgi:hypothetical protein